MGCAGSSQKADEAHGDSGGGGGAQDDEDDYNPLTKEDIKSRIVCSEKAELFTLGASGMTLRYAYLSQRGYYPEDLYKVRPQPLAQSVGTLACTTGESGRAALCAWHELGSTFS